MSESHPSQHPSPAGPFGRSGLNLGRYAGVRLRADWSLLIIFALIVVHLGGGLLPTWHPDWSPLLIWALAGTAGVLFLLSVALHEMSHALMANRHDIPVRQITLFVFGGMAHMEREPPSPKAEFWMAIVGPLTSIAIGLAATLAGSALAQGAVANHADQPEALLAALGPAATLLLWLGPINLLLGLFNMVPGFPLDGGRVLRAILWGVSGDRVRATRWASGAGRLVAWTLMAAGVSMMLGVTIPILGGGVVQGLWLILIGWFLNNAARMSFYQLLVQESLTGVRVRDIMTDEAHTISPNLTIDELVRERYMPTGRSSFLVVGDDQELLGIVNLSSLRSVPRQQWSEKTATEVMTNAEPDQQLAPDDDAASALQSVQRDQVLPVVDNGRVVGAVGASEVLRWLSLFGPLGGEPGFSALPPRAQVRRS